MDRPRTSMLTFFESGIVAGCARRGCTRGASGHLSRAGGSTLMTVTAPSLFELGEESSVWFKLTPLLKRPDNPMALLMEMAKRYGGVIPITMAAQRVVLLTEPD